MDAYAQAATRHLRDSKLLFGNQRFDNAVYLAGYVAECSMKAMIEVFDRHSNPRQFGHNLRKLQQEGLNRSIRLQPKLHSFLSSFAIDSTELAKGHPDRRYWATGRWRPDLARAVLELAEEIYQKTLLEMVLSGYLRRSDLG
ncbi:HEPN domain-containing protein [Alicyclobacillus sendaiensis]|uniref:HEPN domain-containing protein n=1 Tax=Alicyclobacillus sendaiensis TaxID=192387 RepID=UPI000785A66F|nr:HEPN domain-containing protein [Alicyclobacillus sendaiensis]